MRTFQALCISLCCSISLLGAGDLEVAGYRASYPEQTVGIDHLSVCPKHTRKGRFGYGDSHAGLNTIISSGEYGNVATIVGARNVQLRLGSKVRDKNTTYGMFGLDSTLNVIDSWKWQAAFLLQPDVHHTSLSRSTRYIGTLHGIYETTEASKLHVGAYAELGMRASIVHPIVGIDYQLNHWLFEAIYPIKAGVSFQGIPSHRLSAMIRPLYTAVRVRKGLHNHPAIATYQGMGSELRWDWSLSPRWNLWVTLGSTLSGTVTIGDKNNNHRHHIHTHRAPYAQIGFTFGL